MEIYGAMKSSGAKVIFSHGESADDTIRRIVSQAKNTKEIVVVSDDRDIQYAVRALGAKTSGSRAFLDRAKTPNKNVKRAGARSAKQGNEGISEAGKYIPQTDESRITSEMSRIWLDPKKKRKKGT